MGTAYAYHFKLLGLGWGVVTFTPEGKDSLAKGLDLASLFLY